MRLLFNSLRESRRKKEFPPIATVKISLRRKCLFGIFTCSHITFVMVYSFYFLCVGSRRNEFNSLEWREGGEVRSLLLTLFAMLNLFSSFTDDKMILQFIAVHDTFIIILLQYIIFPSERYTFRTSSRLLTSPPSLSQRLLHSFLLEPKHRKKK